jgi:hypothetical protein
MTSESVSDRVADLREDISSSRGGRIGKGLLIVLAIYVVICLVLGWYWSREPELFSVRANAEAKLPALSEAPIVGAVTTTTAIKVAELLLHKPGGYLSNDIMPPGVLLDNIPSWEYGVLTQQRDLVRALRDSFSRSQSQSTEDPDLALADPRFSFTADSWMLPSSESMYKEGIKKLESYLTRLVDPTSPNAQFYSRADNLRMWLEVVSTRMGSLSQRLSASVGQTRIDTDLAGDAEASQSTGGGGELEIKTPWLEIDNVFYEARGATWALIHYLRAMEYDFADVLKKKNALISLQQIVRELEQSQEPIFSPLILNGTGFGLVANHSLVMASYISRANAGLIDLQELLSRG